MASLSERQQRPTGTPPLVCCVIVNWNRVEETLACLKSLAAQDYPRLKVVVVDNASTDQSAQQISTAFPEVHVIQSETNLGFAGGCNLGISEAFAIDADFIWLLNNDTIAPPDTVSKLVGAAADVKVGIVGTVLLYMHNSAAIQAWGGGRVLCWFGYVTHYTRPVKFGADSYLTFASVLIRRELLIEIGPLDEKYFMYFDDADFCFRARRAGWKLTVAPHTAVLHKVGASSDAKRKPSMERIVTASGLRFLHRHAKIPWLSMTLFLSSKFAKRLLHGNLPGIKAISLGVADWRRERSKKLRAAA